jgi:DNA-binding transcriptional LysR family regulator
VAARDVPIETRPTLPLALLPAGSLYRQHALEALGRAGRPWAITAISDSIAGLQAAVYAGLAVSIFPLCALTPHVRRLGEKEGLPTLPALEIMLQRRSSEVIPAVDRLAEYIMTELGNTLE